MAKISYLNGEFIDHKSGTTSIEDRGFQMGDGVYEVVLSYDQKLIDFDPHIERLYRSCSEIGIKFDQTKDQIRDLALKLFEKNKITDGTVYIQVTRGVVERVQTCPTNINPTVVAIVKEIKRPEQYIDHISAITTPDIRWLRCDIKSICLLPSSLARKKAEDAGVGEAIMIRDGVVTEGSFSNVFIVAKDGSLKTKASDNLILPGITRKRVISLASQIGLKVEEKSFEVDELYSAKEVFLTSASLLVKPITEVDGKKIGDGIPGPVSAKLRELYIEFMKNSAKC